MRKKSTVQSIRRVFLLLAVPLLGNLLSANVKVLTYSSMTDKGGLGDEIKKLSGDKVDFITSKDFAGMLGTLRRLKRDGKLATVDMVLGLNESNYQSAVKEGLIVAGQPFEEATYSILVNKEKFPQKDWPKTWEEAQTKLAGKILIQDPRTSEVGLTWLLNSSKLKNLPLEQAKTLPKKVFSNWSSSFEAFESNLAPAVWTYSTSAAYYHCAGDKKAANLVNMPLPFYPKDKNYVAKIATTKNAETQTIIDLVLSDAIQKQIWQKNWMFPAKAQKMPDCFAKVWFPKDSKEVGAVGQKEVLRLLDQWSL